jgi:hypothetical protein
MFMDKEDENIFSKIAKEAKSFLGLQLDEGVSSSYANKEDTARVKYGLNKLGYYDEPEKTGMNTIPDKQMFDGVKDFQKDNGLQVDGYLKPLGETINKINEGLREMKDSLVKKAYSFKGDFDNLKNKKDEMYRKKIEGGDNYYHRLAMCENAQKGKDDADFSFGLGALKEGKDIFCKTTGFCDKKLSFSKALSDSKKDMSNNIEGLNYGLNNPDKDCRVWLKDLDRKTNTWRNKR